MTRHRLALSCVILLTLSTGTVYSQGPSGDGPRRSAHPGAEPDIPVLTRFDRDADRLLDCNERDSARAYSPRIRSSTARSAPAASRGSAQRDAPDPADVKSFPASVTLYDASVARTQFIEFEARRAYLLSHPDIVKARGR